MTFRLRYISILCVATLLAGCKGSQPSASKKDSPLQRKPIVEVAEQQLKDDLILIEAKMQQENGNITEAMGQYHKRLALDPKNGTACYELSRIFLEKIAVDSALFYAKKAVEADPNNDWFWRQMADVYEMRQDAKGLTQSWEHIVALNPENLDYYYELSNAYIKANDVAGAIEVLNRVEKKVGVTEVVSLQKQKLWEALGDDKKALHEVEVLADAMPQEMKYNAIMAECYMKRKDYPNAKRYYDNIALHHPDDEYIHISLAGYYKQVGEPQKAIEELGKGFANDALDCKTKVQVLFSFFSSEEFYKTYAPATFHLFDTVVAHCPDSDDYALYYGDVLMRQDKFAEAIPWLRRYIAVDSGLYEAWEALLICENALRPEEQEQLLRDAHRAAELFPLHSLPLFLQGSIAVEEKDYQKALEYFERCESLGFNNGYLEEETISLLAECHYRLGNREKAWRYFDNYLAKHPDDIHMLNNYAYYLAECNIDLEKAEAMSRRTIEAEPENATFLDTYAWILHQMGRDKEALPYMVKAIKNDKEPSETLIEHEKIIRQNQ